MQQSQSGQSALPAYPNGHHAAVLASHLSRTAQNSAAHLLPHLKAGMKLLDIGCGPGTITTSFADFVGPSGEIVGIDPSEDVIAAAADRAAKQYPNVRFQNGDGTSLPFKDGEFDVVHAHQVLQHITEPVKMIKEMRDHQLERSRWHQYHTLASSFPATEGLRRALSQGRIAWRSRPSDWQEAAHTVTRSRSYEGTSDNHGRKSSVRSE